MSECSLSQATDGRYRIIEPLGRGATATVHLVEEIETRQVWVAKQYSLQATPDWKGWELVRRGAQVLKTLDHPAIPRFREMIDAHTDTDVHLWLIEEFIAGMNLREMMREGTRPDRQQACRIAVGILSALEYLHTRSPPVIHRDVKPSNVILRPDGELFLIDFGAVQHAMKTDSLQGSTVVGTYGYMPPEQFMGRAETGSDLYAVGATLLYLLTGREPSDFKVRDMKLTYHGVVGSGPILRVLDGLLAPRVEARFADASVARRALEKAMRDLKGPRQTRALESTEGNISRELQALMDDDQDVQWSGDGSDESEGSTPRVAQCPACDSKMHASVAGDESEVEIDRCNECHGVWLDVGDLDLLVKPLRPVLETADLRTIRERVRTMKQVPDSVVYRNCPRCDQVMHRRNFGRVSGVVVDECRNHGVFLDDQELERIRAFVAAGGLSLTQHMERSELQRADQKRKQEEERRLIQSHDTATRSYHHNRLSALDLLLDIFL